MTFSIIYKINILVDVCNHNLWQKKRTNLSDFWQRHENTVENKKDYKAIV
jgi:hypothetical protein